MAANKSERALVDEWRDVLALHARTTCELDRALQPYGLGASDFEVLDVLAEGGSEDTPASWRVQELAGRVHLSQSALSRLIARLEKDGLVARGMCPEDRRGVRVIVTEKGLARHAEVRPLQREVLTRMLDGEA
ncbi:MarR family winged helix-turn-helix transcriptional regulator [Streptomyces sp. NBC_00094]|uniref:MarR family winged helix-turn-helix transcriptional regulator n=1 Tax=Streptomyces sp. NBC_00094 TaxID=2903620 RepID=UPI0022560BB4|nr:MarR family transcriptional regulator [Streptomyces sp. NBC_00094]MCX5389151.1 MarR family transcriptional regulator [Streptomyces sp. NBC_00094]